MQKSLIGEIGCITNSLVSHSKGEKKNPEKFSDNPSELSRKSNFGIFFESRDLTQNLGMEQDVYSPISIGPPATQTSPSEQKVPAQSPLKAEKCQHI